MDKKDPICVDILIENQYLDMRPHPEDRSETRDRIEALYEKKKKSCKCGRIYK